MQYPEDVDEAGRDRFDRYHAALSAWALDALGLMHARIVREASRPRILLGCAVWGGYVERFLTVTAPTLRAMGNLPALCGAMDVTLVFHTDAHACNRLVEAGFLDQVEAMGAHVEVHRIPDGIFEYGEDFPNNRYWLLGAAQNLQLQQAKAAGAAYAMVFPDQMYSGEYFLRLMRLMRHDAVVHPGINTVLEPMLEAVEPLKHEGILDLPAERLCGLAVEHMHGIMSGLLMNGRGEWPHAHMLCWASARRFHIISPHLTLAYLSPWAVKRAAMRMFCPLDAQLPYLIPPHASVYMPQASDEMAYAELSAADRPVRSDTYDEMHFRAGYWYTIRGQAGYNRFFRLTGTLPLPEGHALSGRAMDDEAVERDISRVRALVERDSDRVIAALPFSAEPVVFPETPL